VEFALALNMHAGHTPLELALPSDCPCGQFPVWNKSAAQKMKLYKTTSPTKPNLYRLNFFIGLLYSQ